MMSQEVALQNSQKDSHADLQMGDSVLFLAVQC